ncbi:MAG: XRE family transcriptional regulator [Endomicrobium sp.]|jgi:transcriptional regulator with XRE-family HTH domain|nr:XRE family transcriptional regulator [Endomicrobium sp.]
MTETLKQIGARIKAIREMSELSAADFAKSIDIDPVLYLKYENGQADISVSALSAISTKYKVEMTALLSGIEPKLQRISVVKKGRGLNVERRKEYNYQDLAYNFINKKAEFFLVSIEPLTQNATHSYSHQGHEFNYILEGCLKIIHDNKEYILEEGDCVYFDSGFKHAMEAVGNKTVRFLAVVL